MPFTLVAEKSADALPLHLVTADGFAEAEIAPQARSWALETGYKGEAGRLLVYPGADGARAGALFGMPANGKGFSPLATGPLARLLPEGEWYFAGAPERADLAALGLKLGAYAFDRYRAAPGREISFAVPEGADLACVERQARGVFLARDLINTPAGDMGPQALEDAARRLAEAHGAQVSVTAGDALLEANLPMIHAVGRAAHQAPRLIDFVWGAQDAPKVTLVGKGVCFDTGGLDIKPAASMLLMKKDMGGAANVLGLASMIMEAKPKLRLRVLIPAVENAISGNAFRPGDVLASRKGVSVEIGNTDAEGRLVLADALALADEEEPELMIDLATLTGAARVALGPDLPALFSDDEELAAALSSAGRTAADPLWRLPLWDGYDVKLASRVADVNNVTFDGFAGAVTAALFLRRFVERARSWAHFDIYGWNPVEKPHCPIGGEAQAIRAIERVLVDRYG